MWFGIIPLTFQRFYDTAYNDEKNERRWQKLAVQTRNESQLYFFDQFLL